MNKLAIEQTLYVRALAYFRNCSSNKKCEFHKETIPIKHYHLLNAAYKFEIRNIAKQDVIV